MNLDRFRQKAMDVALGAAGHLFPDQVRGAPPSEPVEVVWPDTYSWPMFSAWVDSLRSGFVSLTTVTPGPEPLILRDVVSVGFRHRGQTYAVGIDVGDLSDIPPENPGQFFLYFKMQYDKGGYPWPNVVPGGFVPYGNRIYDVLGPIRRLRDARSFRYDVHGRFGTGAGFDRRSGVIEALSAQRGFNFEGGFRLMRHASFLSEVARSRICIDLPGKGDFCFRLIDYMAVGTCIVAWRQNNRLPVPLEDGRNIVFTDPNGPAVVEACRRLLSDPDRIESLARESRATFDLHLHRSQLASYYLSCFLDRVAAGQA
nr:glycosyltransferase [uncultured Rhodopila sp.]